MGFWQFHPAGLESERFAGACRRAARGAAVPSDPQRRLRAAALLWLLLTVVSSLAPAALAKTPGATHCYGRTCHRVSTLDEMDAIVGRAGFMKTSFYDDCKVDRFNACGLTSSGALFRPDLPDNAASPLFPDGTVLLAYNPANGRAAVVRVNSAGPYWGDRKLDVSRATAEKLGFHRKGVAELMVGILKSPEPHEASYKKLRTYDRVPGYIGAYANYHQAQAAALARLNLEFTATQPRVAEAGPLTAADVSAVIARRGPVEKRELFQHAILYLDPVGPQDTAAAVAPVSEVSSLSPVASLATDEMQVRDVARAAAQPATHVAALDLDPYSWRGLMAEVTVFVSAAIHHARPKGEVPQIFAVSTWPERLHRLVWRARQQARAGYERRSAAMPFAAWEGRRPAVSVELHTRGWGSVSQDGR